MNNKVILFLKSQMVFIVIALFIAIFIYWLSSEFRPDGILGLLQVLLQPVAIIPYIAGAIFGGDAHNPNSFAIFLALFLQFYLIVLAIRFVLKKIRGK